MRNIDFSPYYRSSVGFDRLFGLLDTFAQPDNAQAYPPYNIEKTGETSYRITMAVAGFSQEDITIEVHEHTLSVKAEKADDVPSKDVQFLHRGIAARAFERRFQLADHVEIQGAALKNGLLHIELNREVPEQLKPRKIAIATPTESDVKQIEAKLAA